MTTSAGKTDFGALPRAVPKLGERPSADTPAGHSGTRSAIEVGNWSWRNSARIDGRRRPHTQALGRIPLGGLEIAVSPRLAVTAGTLEVFEVQVTGLPVSTLVRVELVGLGHHEKIVTYRDAETISDCKIVLVHSPTRGGEFVLRLKCMGQMQFGQYLGVMPPGCQIDLLAAHRTTYPPLPALEKVETALPHWNRVERWIHRRCKQSRFFNSLVAALEVRVAREEVLSLPQYLSLCPTGQCNATCAFCSVTINRTGISKRQQPLEAMRRFTAPAAKTVRMYGIEGNGEPMLHRDFPGLAHHVLAGGAIAYLITNASQMSRETLPLLLGFDSINISMNAATAETHRRVMGLKNFGEITVNIAELMRQRGYRSNRPHVSISMVVTRDNVFEAVAFLELAERLGVDRALLRPLSELGNDQGAVEDLRDLVPYESDIADLVESVGDYLAQTASKRRTDIVFEPTNFNATRPDPPVMAVLAAGHPGRVLPPRSSYWASAGDTVDVTWLGPDRLKAASASPGNGAPFLRSDLVAVPPGVALTIKIKVGGPARSGLVLRALDMGDREIAVAHPIAHGGEQETLELSWPPSPVIGVRLELQRAIAHALDVEIDLGPVRRPAPIAEPVPSVPPPRRWEPASPGVKLSWQDRVMDIAWDGPPGPYLAKSYSRPCVPGTTITYRAGIAVTSGMLGIGILNQDFTLWVKTFTFEPGRRDAELVFDTGPNSRIQVVVYSAGQAPLRAEIDWTEAMQSQPLTDSRLGILINAAQRIADENSTGEQRSAADAKLLRREAQRAARDDLAKAQATAVKAPAPEVATPASRGGRLSRLVRDGRTIHCHKPWTDLANFTLDGRVDVCCIATGASQARFALGNLNTQSFQQIWNGPQAREFRRTVNEVSGTLPPCQRCPMAKAYSGPMLSPEGTCFSTWARFDRAPFNRSRIGRYALFALFVATYWPVHTWLFRGYHRPPFRELVRRIRG